MKRSKVSFAGSFVVLGFVIGALLLFLWHREEMHWQEIAEARQEERDIADRRLADTRQEMDKACQSKMKDLDEWWRTHSQARVDSVARVKRISLDSANQVNLRLLQQNTGLHKQNLGYKDSIRTLNSTLYQMKAKLKQNLRAGQSDRSRKFEAPVLRGSMRSVPFDPQGFHNFGVKLGLISIGLFVLTLLRLCIMRLRAPKKLRTRW